MELVCRATEGQLTGSKAGRGFVVGHQVDDLPHGLEVAELDVEGSDPVRCDALAMFLIIPSSTASATLPPRGGGGCFW